ncbi:hypothetical protein JRQ81_011122 [Phrynocephalus forsythii]|uniref:Uncharacterized protein n=1 Tax=Phrynocephalus forsythii TaxID=171643 RepID=A0A9Q0X7H8_9SAUR|nr:hypothetical protein JRQ81_011122 [Phrynocephalus forsythii]
MRFLPALPGPVWCTHARRAPGSSSAALTARETAGKKRRRRRRQCLKPVSPGPSEKRRIALVSSRRGVKLESLGMTLATSYMREVEPALAPRREGP